MSTTPPYIQAAWEAALAARTRAYAPYSRFQVGAAIVLADGTIVPGCNVENASYGGTICAERTAILGAIAHHGRQPLQAVVVVADVTPTVVPCALCLQVIAEHGTPELPIYLGDLHGIRERVRLADLLPRAFTSSSLPR